MSRIRILPVYPEFPPSFWSGRYALEMLGTKSAMPPTGLATVMAMLPEEHFDIFPIADENVRPVTDDEIQRADLVFASAMIVQRNSLENLTLRAHKLGKKVVAGGPYPTSYADEVSADHLVLGEAELTLPGFIADLLAGNAKRVYKEAGATPLVQLTKKGKPLLDTTPVPRWDLLDFKDYFSIAVQYSRGCPFDCEFCDITAKYGREPRTKSPEQMVSEFDALYNRGWRGSVFIVDDNFIGNKANVRKLLPVLQKWQEAHGFPFSLFTEASMDLALPIFQDILHGMVAAGFDQVFVGIESVDPEVLKNMNKGQNKGDLLEKVRTLQRAGLEVLGGFIIGSDGEKPEVFENLFNYIQAAGIVVPMPGLLTALRDTRLYKRLQQEGRLREESTGNNTHHLGFNFKPQLDEKFLLEGYANLLKTLFDSKNYYARCRTLAAVRGEHHQLNRFSYKGFRALASVLYKNLVRRPDTEFMRYMAESVLHPKQFPESVAQAVKLHHFRTITDATLGVREYKAYTSTLIEQFEEKVKEAVENRSEDWEKVQRWAERTMARARRRYNRLHEDFQHQAEETLSGLNQKVNKILSQYQPTSFRSG